VVVCKGKMAAELDTDVQGARKAAQTQNIYCTLPALRYTFATPEIIAGASKELRKDQLRMLTKDEVREELEEVLEKLPPPVRVVFSNQMCRACGQVGDQRLMEDKCHREKTRDHPGKLKQRFRCGIKVEDWHWSCCGGRKDEEGCIEICDNCNSPWGTGEPCVLIKQPTGDMPMENYQVFLKEHDLKEHNDD